MKHLTKKLLLLALSFAKVLASTPERALLSSGHFPVLFQVQGVTSLEPLARDVSMFGQKTSDFNLPRDPRKGEEPDKLQEKAVSMFGQKASDFDLPSDKPLNLNRTIVIFSTDGESDDMHVIRGAPGLVDGVGTILFVIGEGKAVRHKAAKVREFLSSLEWPHGISYEVMIGSGSEADNPFDKTLGDQRVDPLPAAESGSSTLDALYRHIRRAKQEGKSLTFIEIKPVTDTIRLFQILRENHQLTKEDTLYLTEGFNIREHIVRHPQRDTALREIYWLLHGGPYRVVFVSPYHALQGHPSVFSSRHTQAWLSTEKDLDQTKVRHLHQIWHCNWNHFTLFEAYILLKKSPDHLPLSIEDWSYQRLREEATILRYQRKGPLNAEQSRSLKVLESILDDPGQGLIGDQLIVFVLGTNKDAPYVEMGKRLVYYDYHNYSHLESEKSSLGYLKYYGIEHPTPVKATIGLAQNVTVDKMADYMKNLYKEIESLRGQEEQEAPPTVANIFSVTQPDITYSMSRHEEPSRL